MQTGKAVTQSKRRRRRRILGGCGVLVVAASLVFYGSLLWIGYSFTSPYLAEVPVPNAEQHVYAYASGFPDVFVEYIVEHNEGLHILPASIGE